ncbi:NAD(P)H-dependent 6'-deoxychalcone synthase-like isoform X5 [Quercus robur]|uniref:NAD(P)H-dependent 6'-deoxychalcone synthase-like isoform X4 n=1 Tax=Quercus robur TaxID=38942 RepID=UPI0021617B4C|nr:NAD(P)H-dependent 6'-deoxychalcone synthase-like isoform X4 [Quercus robur]XP_050287417.1 NAD(P)H-dependent 6'-deoxychalcone synthase-like isoform X5 [Quercus robur]
MATTTLNSVTKIPKMELSSSSGPVSMPVIGFGSAADNNDSAILISAVLESIKLGYRHFDTASAYGTEQALGEAIAEALRLGLIPSRDDLFVTSKLWPTEAHAHLVLPSLQKSLRTLQLEYLDLYLIHWPISVTPGPVTIERPFDKQDLMPMDFKSVWAAMEECQRLGLTKSIGVSNFSCKKLENLLSFATIPPSVNQVEMNLIWQQNKLTEFCKANGIIVTAFSPLGAKGVSWGTNDVMDNEVLKEIAKTRGKTVAQVLLCSFKDCRGSNFIYKRLIWCLSQMDL